MATITGTVLGFIAVQTGSILPGMLYHFCHNSIPLLLTKLTPEVLAQNAWLGWFGAVTEGGGFEWHWSTVAIGTAIAIAILLWLRRLPYAKTEEESLYESIRQSYVDSRSNAGQAFGR
ncbi:MAG: hypothetical protein JNM18_18610, partial [Planctomycetaceae bacterium]|nr:hypothetical protein [Planctomycetaceae bacterium]